jgi:hypothetical protein
MKKQIITQLEKFNARQSKASGMQAIEGKVIEQKIAKEMEEKKSLYTVIGVLERSISMLTNEVAKLSHENTMLQEIKQENAELKSMFVQMMTEVQEIRKVTVGSLYMNDEKKRDLGMNLYQSPLHRFRSEQIKEKGYFVDPTPEDLRAMGYPAEDAVVEEVVEVVTEQPTPVVEKRHRSASVGIPTKRGRKTETVKAAIVCIEQHTLPSGRYDWKTGSFDLIYAVLTIAAWAGVDIHKVTAIQTDAFARKAFQQVAYNKEKYDFTTWAAFIAKYEEVTKNGN